MKFKEVLDSVPYEIFERGEDYYNKDYILSLNYDENDKTIINAKVEGSRFNPYSVKVVIWNDELVDYHCNCPYDWGPICKHLVAVFLAIQNEDHLKSTEDNNNNNNINQDLYSHDKYSNNSTIDVFNLESKSVDNSASKTMDKKEILESTSKEELIEFLIDYSNKNKDFENKLFRKFKESDEFDITYINDYIDQEMKNDYYGNYLDEEGFEYIEDQLENILGNFLIELNDSNYKIIINRALYILFELLDFISKAIAEWVYVDFENIVSYTYLVLYRAIICLERNGSEKEKNRVFDLLINKGLSSKKNYISNVDFFEIAALLVNEDNKDYFNKNFDKFKNKKENHHLLTISKVKSIEKILIEKLEGKEASYDFMMNNLEIDTFTRDIINQAIENNNLKLAEEVCIEKIKMSKEEFVNLNFNFPLKKWQECLYKIYQLFKKDNKNKEEEIKIEKEINLVYELLKNGDLDYYSILKDLYKKEGTWDEEYQSVIDLIRENFSFNSYISILNEEKEWALLFEAVKSEPNTIFIYGNNLAKEYGEKVFEIYKGEIQSEANVADNRGKYKKVCHSIEKLYSAGGHEMAKKIIGYLKENNKKRPAFQDELNSLERKVNR